MTLRNLEISAISIPLETPFVTALRRADSVQAIRVAMYDAEGRCGFGEAPSTEAITGESLQSIRSTLQESIVPQLEGCSFATLEDALTALHGSCEGNRSAKAAAEMALFDLHAQMHGQPLFAYLGGERSELHSYVTISLDTPSAMAENARKAVQRGLRRLKIKLGGKDGLDIQRLDAVRSAAPEALVLVDPNQAWTRDEALDYLSGLHSSGVDILEQPVKADDIEGLRRLTKRKKVTIMADEAVFSLADAQKVTELGAADMVNIKLMKCGGISKALEIIEYCEKNGVTCMMGSMLESPVSIAAAAHLAMAYPKTVVCCDLDSPLLYKTITQDAPVAYEGDRLILRNPCGI